MVESSDPKAILEALSEKFSWSKMGIGGFKADGYFGDTIVSRKGE